MANIDEPLFKSDGEAGSTPSGDDADLESLIRRLVEGQPYAVLCTQSRSQPYGAVVAFAFSDDLRQAVLVTPVTTRKYRMLTECDRVALVIDSRPDHPGDLMKTEAVTVTGRAVHVEDDAELERCARLLLARHDYLKHFVESPSCALFRIDVVRYIHVARFQEVRQWTP